MRPRGSEMKRIFGGSLRHCTAFSRRLALVPVLIVLLFSLACGQWKTLPLSEIESHPENLTDEKVRVHFQVAATDTSAAATTPSRSQRENLGTGSRAVVDSTCVLRVKRVAYPMLHGVTLKEAKLNLPTVAPDTATVDLRQAVGADLRVASTPGNVALILAGFIAVSIVATIYGWAHGY